MIRKQSIGNTQHLQAFMDTHNLSVDRLPSLDEWHKMVEFSAQQEKIISVMRETAIDIPGSLVFVFDMEMTIIAVNLNAAQMLGFEQEYEVTGRPASDFLADEDLEASMKRFDDVTSGQDIPEYERILYRPDGEPIYTLVKLSLIEREESNTKFVKSVMRDVTDLRLVENEANRHQSYLEQVLQNAPVILWACNTNGDLTLSHGMGLASIGRQSGELVGVNLFDAYAHDSYFLDHIKKGLEGEQQHIQAESDGEVFNVRFKPIIDNGQVMGLVGVSTNITDLIRAQEKVAAIQRSTERTRDYLQAILNNSSDGIAVASINGKIQHTNPAFNQLVGLESHQAYGTSLTQYATSKDKMMIEQMLDYVISSKQSVRFEAIIISVSSDAEASMDISCSPILTDDDEIYGIVYSVRDISAYQELLKSLAQSHDKVLQSSRLKSEFLAVMSHEIRTPLHAIMGLSEMIQDTVLGEDQRELIDLVQEQSHQLLDMLNSVLDYSKLEAQKMILEHRQFDVKKLITGTSKQFIGQAWNKNLQIHVNADVPDDLQVYGDSQRLQEVFRVFISNALKFTNKGEITVTSSIIEKTEKIVTLKCKISDTGIGIPEDKIASLFSPFSQADSSHTRMYGGTGLGLAIASRILKLMKSEIHVHSVVDEGTTFEFDISLEIASPLP